MADPEIRPATEADVPEIVAVAEDALYAAYGGFVRPENVAAAIAEWYDPDLVAAAAESDEVELHVAIEDGEVVGFASAEQTWADEVELHVIYVHPDRWGEGIGSALLSEVRSWAERQGVDRIACAAFEENAVGIGFLEAKGFEGGLEATTAIGDETHTEREFVLEL